MKEKILALLTAVGLCLAHTHAGPSSLARDGQALLPVVHAPDAHEALVTASQELADILGRMSGASFALEASGKPSRGIVVGSAAQFPDAPGIERFDPDDVLRQEEYIIRTDGDLVWLVGASEAGARQAVWDFLHRLGYRLYFPGPDWEIIPEKRDLSADLDVFSAPDFHVRRFAWHFGNWADLRDDVRAWEIRNRLSNDRTLPGTFALNTLHIYGAIINKFRPEIEANPGICSIIDGRRTSKLNPANPRTLELAEIFAKEFFEANPDATSISMDPSDGGGWGTNPEELAIGTPSDRATYLANHVADYLLKNVGQKYVGLYAYNMHSPAPEKVKVHPNVIISVATSFIHGGFTVMELMEAWAKAGAEMMGIREYHSVVAWDLARPTGGRASSLSYLAETIPAFHAAKAKFYTTEAGQNWGPQGLGNYFTARVLWDVKEAERLDAILDEFVANCFPEAVEPMTRLYRVLLHPERSTPLSPDQVGRIARAIAEAKETTKDPASLRRLEALTLYARYCELLNAYQDSRTTSPAADQQKAAEELIKFAYRTRDNRMVSSLALYRDLPNRNTSVTRPEGADWKIPEDQNPWKSSEPFAPGEVDEMLVSLVANNPLLDFEPVVFSRDLVPAGNLPAAALSLSHTPARNFRFNFRRPNQIFTCVEGKDAEIRFQATPGTILRNRGDITISLYPWDGSDTGQETEAPEAGAEAGEENVPVFLQSTSAITIPPDREVHAVEFKPQHGGAFMVEIQDAQSGVLVADWPSDLPFTLESSEERQFFIVGRVNLVFYVPKGTRTLGLFASGKGTIFDANDRPAHELDGKVGYVSLPIEEGMDGKFWRFYGMVGGRITLLTVPPFMAPSARELMLPREVVEADMPPAALDHEEKDPDQ